MPRDPIIEAKDKWVQHGWPMPDLMAALTSIVRVQRLLSLATDRALRRLDLTNTRFEALYLLYFSDGATLSLTEMSQRLRVHQSSITNIVDRLEAQGLVRRGRAAADRRLVMCELLPDGRILLEKGLNIMVDEIYSKAPWSKVEIKQMFELLATLRWSLGDTYDAAEAGDS